MASIIDGGDAFSDFEEDAPGFVGTFSPASHTVNEVAQATRRQFGDDAGVQIDDADIIRWVNDAQDVISSRNRFLKATSVVLSEPNRSSYRWPTERILQVESVHFDGRKIPNVPFAAAEDRFSTTDTTTGVPQFWYEWAGKFIFYPAPSEQKEITLYLTLKPTPVTTLADTLSVPDHYFVDIVRYVLTQAYEMDEDWEAVKAKQDQFDSSVNSLGEEARAGQHMTYETIGLVDDWC